MPNNIPTNAFVVLPFASLDPKAARILFISFSLLLFLLSTIVLLKMCRFSLTTDVGMSLFAMVLLFRPVAENIAFGQLYFIFFFLLVVSLWGIKKNNVFLSALPVAVGILIKGYGIVPLLWFARSRRWKEFSLAIAMVLTVIILTIPLFKLDTWSAYYDKVLSTLGRLPSDGHVAYQCINGFFSHMLSYDPQWHPFPIAELSGNIAFAIGGAMSLFAILFVLRNPAIDDEQTALSFSAASAVGVITAPLAEEYHFVLFIPLIVYLFAKVLPKSGEPIKLDLVTSVLVIGLLMLALPIPYKSLQLVPAPIALLAYPKLFGGLLILATYIYVSSPKRKLHNE